MDPEMMRLAMEQMKKMTPEQVPEAVLNPPPSPPVENVLIVVCGLLRWHRCPSKQQACLQICYSKG